jgi:hypothetical protein
MSSSGAELARGLVEVSSKRGVMIKKTNSRLLAGLSLTAAIVAGAATLLLTASTAAANPNATATASISVTGDSSVCHLTVTYTWSGFPGGNDIAEIFLSPKVSYADLYVYYQKGGGGSQSWTFDLYGASGSTWQGKGDLYQGRHGGNLVGPLLGGSDAISLNTVTCP